MDFIEIDGKKVSLTPLKIELPSLDLISWLAHQLLYPKVFWKEKEEDVTRVAIGNLLSFSHLPTLVSSEPSDIHLYGGMRFTQQITQDNTWNGFPNFYFWLPAIEIVQDREKTEAIFYSSTKKAPPSEFFDIHHPSLKDPPFSLLNQHHIPDFPLWQDQVNLILEQIASEHFDKLVLARKSSFYFASPLSPWSLLSHLNAHSTAQVTVFAFQLSPHLCFLGATPEKLFHRTKNLLQTDAVAATRPRGKTPEEDLLLEQELLQQPKEAREFQCVARFLETSLLPLSENMAWHQPKSCVLKTSHVQHLYNRLSVKLKTDVTDAHLIHTLHPTPALGGYPRAKAMSLLSRIEPFDRGWYGSPLGIISSKRSSLYVGIRSGLVSGRSLHLFAGAGLVAGSSAEKEWNELDQKIRPFTEFISKGF